MMYGKKYVLSLLMTLAFALLAIAMPMSVMAESGATGPGVTYHTQDEIKAFIKAHPAPMVGNSYSVKPSLTAPYAAGKLSDETDTYALNSLNQIRYVAGIDANVERDETYSQKAQAAALVNAVNGELSHYPTQPEGMDDDLYALGKSGAASSNIASGAALMPYVNVHMWMNDSDSSNIDRVGHRRWMINPGMKKTGFGAVGRYSAICAHDGAFYSGEVTGVAWPAQNMPVEMFYKNYAWSVSFGKNIDISAVEVTLKNDKGDEWHFSQDSTTDGCYFNVDNANYGQQGCVIFRPILSYEAGDHFDVTITGVYDEPFKYSVDFFSICNGEHKYTSTKLSDPTCTSQGVIRKICDNCGDVDYEYLDALGHDYQLVSSQDGLLSMHCNRCGEDKTGSYPVSFYTFWAKSDDTSGSYSSRIPSGLKPGDSVNYLISYISYSAESDNKFGEFVYESSDSTNCVIDKSARTITFKRPGEYQVKISAKYNTEASRTYKFTIEGETPEIESEPSAASVVYKPGLTLNDIELTGGKASVDGTWAWVDPETALAVPGGTYTCRFSPENADVYNSVDAEIEVKVSKAVPYVKEVNAENAVYGQALEDVEVSGTACLSDTDDTAVAGSFQWKDGSVKPTVSDSETTEYEVVFKPEDAENFEEAAAKVKVKVAKAESPAGKPESNISVPYTCDSVSNEILENLEITNWKFAEADLGKTLAVGTGTACTLLYVGEDADNYENISAAATLTREACKHDGSTTMKDAVPADCEHEGKEADAYCDICGEKISTGETIEALGHDWDEGTVTKEATCEEDGTIVYKCTREGCDAERSETIGRTGHEYSSEWNTDDNNHWHSCTHTNCEAVDSFGPHDWVESITKQPTCTEEGEKTLTCSVCGKKKTEVIEKLDHEWSDSYTIDKAATCTEEGSKSIHCINCGETKDAEVIPALGHDWNTEADVTEPTCTEAGSEAVHCSRCDAIKEGSEKVLPATGHKYGAWKETAAATELAAGEQTRTCSLCGKTEKRTTAQLAPTLPTVKISKPKAAKKAAVVKWKKVSKKKLKKIKKIEIQYSTDKTFTTSVKTKYAKAKKTSCKIKGLTKGKKYYVRIRAYTKAGSDVHVSKWSKVKRVKAK